jgi:hypothetical protein
MNNGNQEQKTIMNKSEIGKRVLTVVFLVLSTTCFLYWGLSDKEKLVEPHKKASIVSSQATKNQTTIEQLVVAIAQLPDGPFKANLYVVLATEYAGDTEALKQILQEFTRLQMEKLQNKKTI